MDLKLESLSMFTGIIQDIGTILSICRNESTLKITFATQLNLKHLELGASIACNGCCLTVVSSKSELKYNIFSVEVGPETFQLTNFLNLHVDSFVNLEPALKVGDSLGGHHVTGHIDSLCEILDFHETIKGFFKLTLKIQNKFSRFIIEKGSIAIGGISLTVVQLSENNLGEMIAEIMIIPHTYHNTILKYYKKGMRIEVEFDQSIKAIASLLKSMLPNYIQARK
ncbi:riboflavin synthase [Fluviispira multicolorata]|uniref:Riboflavin synthase n=1 Tax=Fluviispira multicolorata TaxID=2654512 RepID=A0A833N254_9BACT|nr:riboflavin synthase [Fluviispira multicolorata]KAB8027427.1 riboflavin synthase [Fluviispira multicolorata]